MKGEDKAKPPSSVSPTLVLFRYGTILCSAPPDPQQDLFFRLSWTGPKTRLIHQKEIDPFTKARNYIVKEVFDSYAFLSLSPCLMQFE
ncbi:unnamed protein product [Calypogeia fissa]